MAASSPAHAQQAQRSFDIPAQALSSALIEFSRQSEVMVVADSTAVNGRRSAAVQGAMTADEALNRLLAGSGLIVSVRSGGGYTVQAPPASPTTLGAADGAASSEATEEGEIVVTGTFIRGVAPTGNQVLGVNAQDIQASGAMSTNEVLAGIPQISNFFNDLNGVGLTGNGAASQVNLNTTVQVQRPALRNIGSLTLGSTPTLILMDGHRLVGAGVNQASPDAGVIPPGMLERVEIVTDGGTALYGTDAVGGVINFITRRSFDGVRMSGRYGFGDDYQTYDVNFAAGLDWGSGSVFGAVSYNETDPVFGIDREWYGARNWNALATNGQYGQPTGRNCTVGNVTVGTTNYAIITPTDLGAAGSFNACDPLDYQTIVPEQTSESYFAGFTQELIDGVELHVRGFFTHRESLNFTGPLASSVSVDNEVGTRYNPNYPLGEIAGNPQQSVLFNYAPYHGFYGGRRITDLETWGVTPTLTWEIGAGWQLTGIVNYGESETYYRNRDINVNRQNDYAAGDGGDAGSAVPGGYLNPYNVGATNPAILADILNWQRYGFAHQTLTNYRAVFDGPLLTLPGGEVRGAFGAEFIKEEVERRQGQSNFGEESSLPLLGIERDVTAFFGELNIPIIGANNRFPLVESVVLSLSARRDDYSDFGETTNPQVGLTWEVSDWFRLRGNWGQSFNAPSSIEVLGGSFPAVAVGTTTFVYNPAPFPQPVPGVSRNVTVQGADNNLRPQTGETWAVGLDAEAPFLRDLRVSATYYHIEFNDTLGSPPLTSASSTVFNTYREFVRIQGLDGSGVGGVFTATDISNFVSNAGGNPADAQVALDNPGAVYQMLDLRFRNLGDQIEEGVDFSVRYSHDLDWATLDLGFSGNYQLNSESRARSTLPYREADLDQRSRARYTVNAGLTIDDFYTRVTYNRSAGYQVTPGAATSTATGPFQTTVDDFDVVDLFFRYDLDELGPTDLQITLNIDNVFDTDPPVLRTSATTSAANGMTLGRVVTVGLSADF